MIARVRSYAYEEVCVHIDRLAELVKRGASHDIVAEMKHMVPEFKSNNSIWQTVDNEIGPDDSEKMTETEIAINI